MIESNRKDAFGIVPQIGDFIAYNPPRYKGTRIAKVIGFAKSGLPKCVDAEDLLEYEFELLNGDLTDLVKGDLDCFIFTPKTGFVIAKGTQDDFNNL